MPKKRPSAAEVATEHKRYKSAIDEMADEFVCPIAHELPVDPVTAEDGRVYERSSIEEWFGTPQLARAAQVKSPVTNEMMGKRLFPAVQARNTIKSMVQSGALSGAKADAWKQRIEDENEVARVRKMAEDGDGRSMSCLGSWYRDGHKGLAKDPAQGFAWFKRSALKEYPLGLSNCGVGYISGKGTDINVPRGMVMLGQAAALDCAYACYCLGFGHRAGWAGLDKDPAEVTRWFKKAQGCADFQTGDNVQSAREEVAAWLRDHPAAT